MERSRSSMEEIDQKELPWNDISTPRVTIDTTTLRAVNGRGVAALAFTEANRGTL